jgi:hypothetical protein
LAILKRIELAFKVKEVCLEFFHCGGIDPIDLEQRGILIYNARWEKGRILRKRNG